MEEQDQMTKATALTILQDERDNADEGPEGMRPVYDIAIAAIEAQIRSTDEHKQEIEDALDYLLDIAAETYPKYYRDDEIAVILDLYKELFD